MVQLLPLACDTRLIFLCVSGTIRNAVRNAVTARRIDTLSAAPYPQWSYRTPPKTGPAIQPIEAPPLTMLTHCALRSVGARSATILFTAGIRPAVNAPARARRITIAIAEAANR